MDNAGQARPKQNERPDMRPVTPEPPTSRPGAHAHFRKGVTEWNIQMMIQLVDGSTVKRFSSAQDTGGGALALGRTHSLHCSSICLV